MRSVMVERLYMGDEGMDPHVRVYNAPNLD